MNKKFNKEIFEMKLTIITACVLRCDYCFVDKERPTFPMDWPTAKSALDFFLGSPGQVKILKIYGGEPLLNWPLVEKLAIYARRLAKKRGVALTLSLCTNAILLNEEQLRFFKKHNFMLAVSLDGGEAEHDRHRKFPDGAGSFSKVRQNLKKLFSFIPSQKIAVNMSVVPGAAGRVFKNFSDLLALGFETVNIEPVYGYQSWVGRQLASFENSLGKIIEFIFKKTNEEKFYFLATINRDLKYKTLRRRREGVCFFRHGMDVYPDGRMGSSFLLNVVGSGHSAGNVVRGGVKKRYAACVFKNGSRRCRECFEDYYGFAKKERSSEAVLLRNDLSIKAAQELEQAALMKPVFCRYILEAEKRVCF